MFGSVKSKVIKSQEEIISKLENVINTTQARVAALSLEIGKYEALVGLLEKSVSKAEKEAERYRELWISEVNKVVPPNNEDMVSLFGPDEYSESGVQGSSLMGEPK